MLHEILRASLNALPAGVRGRLHQLTRELSGAGDKDQLLKRCREELDIRGKWLRSEERPLTRETEELARQLGSALLAMKLAEKKADPAYLPATGWAGIINEEWSPIFAALRAGDFATLERFLNSFFRNGGLSGFWGNKDMFGTFATEDDRIGLARLGLFADQLSTWRQELPSEDVAELYQPRVGDPWGYNVGGHLIIEPAFEYHELAVRLGRMLAGVDRPVVLEIGGGFGGLAYQLVQQIPGVHYIGVDLPENVIVQGWYLSQALDRRVEVNDPSSDSDVSLIPTWGIAELALSQCDIAINVRSFGEMNRDTVGRYFQEIARLNTTWVYHENLGRPRKDELYGMASTDYPPLKDYALVASSESRWPRYSGDSGYPCRENLFRRTSL